MILIARSRPTPEENLAFDEAMIEAADRFAPPDGQVEAEENPTEILRLWEMPKTCVVLGRASKVEDEVYVSRCDGDGIPILRRVSGGATVIAGPGCMMYSLLISYAQRPSWRMLDVAHSEVMRRIAESVQRSLDAFELGGGVKIDGTCDLTIEGKKFSGNALRCKRNWMLYHGTIMISMSPKLLSQYLRIPPRQPDYRMHRSHDDFVTRLHDIGQVDPIEFRRELELQLASAWSASRTELPVKRHEEIEAKTQELLDLRYLKREWHRSR